MKPSGKSYDTNVTDASQRRHDLREVLNALRWLLRSGSPWRLIPHDLPPWHAVYDQARRWLAAGCFEAIVHDLRILLRLAAGHKADPTAAIIDSRTVQSTPESGPRAGYDGRVARVRYSDPVSDAGMDQVGDHADPRINWLTDAGSGYRTHATRPPRTPCWPGSAIP